MVLAKGPGRELQSPLPASSRCCLSGTVWSQQGLHLSLSSWTHPTSRAGWAGFHDTFAGLPLQLSLTVHSAGEGWVPGEEGAAFLPAAIACHQFLAKLLDGWPGEKQQRCPHRTPTPAHMHFFLCTLSLGSLTRSGIWGCPVSQVTPALPWP